MFKISDLSVALKQEMKNKNTWRKECPVALERLKLITFSYYDFEGNIHNNGEMIILDAACTHALEIFQELYDIKFPVAKANIIEKYNGNDEDSLADNNSSCFNCREITGGGLPSIHSYGLAIDINPVQNPYIAPQEIDNEKVGHIKILPKAGSEFLNRTNIRPGMAECEGVIEIFKKHGFRIWGGTWNSLLDWQHFQPSRPMAQILAIMTPEDATILFDLYIKESKLLDSIDPSNNKLLILYKQSPRQFMKIITESTEILAMQPKDAYAFIKQKL